MRRKPDSDPPARPLETDEARLTEGLQGLFHGAEPPKLLEVGLRAEAERRYGVPALSAAEACHRRPWTLLRGTAWASGLAAAAAVVFVLWQPGQGTETQREALASATDERDVDRNGRVDIFDAYLVARSAIAGTSTDGMPDLDGDGRVTRADADQIARFAVQVAR